MTTSSLDGMRLNVYSSTAGLVAQSDLGQNTVVLTGIPAGTSVKAGDYKVGFEDITGTVSPLADVPAFTVTTSSNTASSTPASSGPSSATPQANFVKASNAASSPASSSASSSAPAGSGSNK